MDVTRVALVRYEPFMALLFFGPRPLFAIPLACLAAYAAPATAAAAEEADMAPLPAPVPPDTARVDASDPTGGAYTSPTLLFIPAAAVPKWNVRVIVSAQSQSPAAIDAKVQPGFGAELGLPGRITLGAGTTWVGGDISPTTNKTDFNLGLNPYGQVRYSIIGAPDGRGFSLGTSATYKFVGFEGDPGEVELAVSSQYRKRYYEAGLQAVIGKDFATTDADAEAHAYLVGRPIPALALGAAGQFRQGLVSQPGETTHDIFGGAIASFTLDRFQLGALGGGTTIGLAQNQAGATGQAFLAARF
jgi:hypothetical protein